MKRTFTYDDVGQLTSESASGYSTSYTYDANGNRTNRTVNGVSETSTVDDQDRLTKVAWSSGGTNYENVYAYHYSGRPTSITYKQNAVTVATETMTWDKESRMLTNSLSNSTYVYNGFDARVSKNVNGTTTTFKRSGADPVSPVLSDVVGSTTTNYLPGISSRVSGTSTFHHSGIKNATLQTNSSQTNTATKRYDAFGNELATSGTWQTRFDYGGAFGYQRDDDTGYKLLGHRYYDPSTGRFLTRDPIKDGRNWYAYCSNDPTGWADATGQYQDSVTTSLRQRPRETKEILEWAYEGGSTMPPAPAPNVGPGISGAVRAGATAAGAALLPATAGQPQMVGTKGGRNGTGLEEQSAEGTLLYRVYGGTSGKWGQYWSPNRSPLGPGLRVECGSAKEQPWRQISGRYVER